MKLLWDDSYSVNVKVIDEQHLRFVDMLNNLMEVVVSSEKGEKVRQVLDQVERYMEEHFATEEKYFKEFDYLEADMHIAEHNKFREYVGGEIKKIRDGVIDPSLELVNYMENWLANHVLEMDKRYVECFHDHGLY